MLGYRPDGKPDRRCVTGKAKAEVRRKLDELRQRRRRWTRCAASASSRSA
jgi:hypothetical protein